MRTNEIAQKAQCSPAAVANYRAGRLGKAGRANIARIEAVLGIKKSSAQLIREALLRGEIVGFDEARKMGNRRLSDVAYDMRRWIESRIPNVGTECKKFWVNGQRDIPRCWQYLTDRGLTTLIYRQGRTEWGAYWIPESIREALK